MALETYGEEDGSRRRNRAAQTAITLFLGIPMTLVLAVALVLYSVWEFLKFQFRKVPLGGKPATNPEPDAPARNQNAGRSGLPG